MLRRAAGRALLDRVVPPVVVALATLLLLMAHGASPYRPVTVPPAQGFWDWHDQSKYLLGALAWAQGNLDPAEHYYLPGYSWLGAPFVGLTPANPFLVPDLVALAVAGWLFTALAARLLGGGSGMRALGSVLFFGTTVGDPLLRAVWVVPWNTTPAAALMYGCLLAGLRFAERQGAARAFTCGLAGGAVVLFRPTDAVVVLGAAGAFGLAAMWRDRVGLRAGFRLAAGAAGAAGVAVPVAVVAAAHLAVFGLARGSYLTLSANTGFEPALLPLRWVLLMLNPRPLLFTGWGLATAFWWMLPGLAGLVAMVLADRGRRGMHLAVGGAAVAYLLLYLTYRDLHPTGLWFYQNYHYFKWLMPIFAVYAVLWLRAGWRPGSRVAAMAGAAAVLVLIPWRVTLTPDQGVPPPSVRDGQLVIPSGLARLDDGVLVHVSGAFAAIYQGEHRLVIGGRVFHNFLDFRLFPRAGMGLLMALRHLPAGAATLETTPGAALDEAVPPSALRVGIRFGVPCIFAHLAPVCRGPATVPASLAVGQTVDASTLGADAWLVAGWSSTPERGRWTIDDMADVAALVTGAAAGGDLELAVDARVLAPQVGGPADVVVLANGTEVAHWRWTDAEFALQRAAIPARLVGANHYLALRFMIYPARAPAQIGSGVDKRRLGMFLRTLRLTAGP